MSYDIEAIYSDLQNKMNWFTSREKVDWLVNEVIRLRTQNEALLEENRSLREELTLVRLTGDGLPEMLSFPYTISEMDAEAKRFFNILPETFHFNDFFQLAAREGLDSSAAKEYLRVFLRGKWLLQTGTRIEKAGFGIKKSLVSPGISG